MRQECLDVGFPFEELLLWTPASEQVAALPLFKGYYATRSNNAISRPLCNGILRESAEKAGVRIRTGATIWEMTEDADGVEVELPTWTGKRTAPVLDPGADRQ